MKNTQKIIINVFKILFITLLLGISTQVNAKAKIQVEFCNNGSKSSSLSFDEVDGTQEKEVCILAGNLGDTEDLVTMYFVDGAINPHTPQFTACKNEKDKKIGLSKYAFFTDEKYEKYEKISFNVKPGETVQKKATLNFNDGFSGMSYGCLITLTGKQKTEKGKLNILLRRGNIIKAKVKGEIKLGVDIGGDFKNLELLHGSGLPEVEIENYVRTLYKSEKMIIQEYLQTGKVTVSTKIKNVGNTKMVGSSNLIVKGSFGYSNIINKEYVLLPLEESEIVFDILDLPIYKGTFNFELDIKQKPVFEFESEDITDDMRKELSENFKGEIYIFPTKLTIIVLVSTILTITIIIVSLIIIRRRRERLDSARTNYLIKSGDTLNSIADKYGCEWSLIAKENNIPAPYNISEGKSITVFDFNKSK